MRRALALACPRNLPLTLDVIERVVVAAFFGSVAVRMLNAYMTTGQGLYLIYLFSECLITALVLVRRTTDAVSVRPVDWAIAVVGTILPSLVVRGGEPLISGALSGTIALLGIAINLGAKLSLRRSFGIVAANRGVKSGGPYYFVRHPMYFGYVVTQAGYLLFNPTPWNASVIAAAWVFQVLRIRAEERILMQDPAYQAYAAKTRYRLIPGLY